MCLLWLGLLSGEGMVWAFPADRPTSPTSRPGEPILVSPMLHVQVPAELTERVPPPVRLLSASRLNVRIHTTAKARVAWQLMHKHTVLTGGVLSADAGGLGTLTLSVPTVRHRTACALVFAAKGARAQRELVLFPSAVLPRVSGHLKALRIGVSDARNLLHAAMAAEGISVEDLNRKHAADYFTGGLVLLAGYERPGRLTRSFRPLLGRVRDGMCLLVINPPAGWEGGGFKRLELAAAHRGSVSLANGMGAAFHASDLGAGPWRAALKAAKPRTPLLWLPQTPASSPARPRPAQLMLTAARREGQGLIVVALLEQLTDPARHAVGRMLLDELILWILRRQMAIRAEKGQ